MIVKLNHQELKQMITEAIKRVEERISITEVFAGLIWHYCINAQDHSIKENTMTFPSASSTITMESISWMSIT